MLFYIGYGKTNKYGTLPIRGKEWIVGEKIDLITVEGHKFAVMKDECEMYLAKED